MRPPLDHLQALSDDTGIIQHAILDVPNRATGYCTDDVSRAFMVALQRLRAEPANAVAHKLAGTYLAFLSDAQMEDGWFHNFMSYDRRWLDERGTQDSFGRALWSLGYGIRFAHRESWPAVCALSLAHALPRVGELAFMRSQSYAILGLWHAIEGGAIETDLCLQAMRRLADELRASYEEHRAEDWLWFEDVMTYDNARLCEAALRAGEALGDAQLSEIGLESMNFYRSVVIEGDVFVPIGNEGWYERGGKRARYGQQPLEAVALVDAAFAAYEVSGDASFLATARSGWLWYYGQNTAGATMVHDGGCRDGIDADRINANMGAESTLASLSAAATMCEAENAFASNVDAQ